MELTTDLVAVFNRADEAYYCLFPDETSVTIDAHAWSFVPEKQAYELVDEPSLFINLTEYQAKYLPYWISPVRRRLTVAGPMDSVSGYGSASAQMIESLSKDATLELSFERTGWVHLDDLPQGAAKLAASLNKPKFPPLTQAETQRTLTEIETALPDWKAGRTRELKSMNRWAIAMTVPPELRRVSSPNVLLYSMWECDTLPDRKNYLLMDNEAKKPKDWRTDPNAWPEWVSARAKILAVPCADQKRVWEESIPGVEAHVIPLGLNPAYGFKPRHSLRATLDSIRERQSGPTEERDKFTLLLYGELAGNPRKPAIELIQELVWPVLDREEDWQIVVKTRGRSNRSLMAAINDPRVIVISGDYTQDQMIGLCAYADCGLALSRYEGWGLPFREMMASGLPVIVSDCSGHAEDTNKEYNYPIPCPTKTRAPDVVGSWYEPDWEAARAALATEYALWKARNKTQSPMGEAASRWITERRPWHKTTMALTDLIERAEEC